MTMTWSRKVRATRPRPAVGAPAARPALELADIFAPHPGFLFHFIWPQNTHQNGNEVP